MKYSTPNIRKTSFQHFADDVKMDQHVFFYIGTDGQDMTGFTIPNHLPLPSLLHSTQYAAVRTLVKMVQHYIVHFCALNNTCTNVNQTRIK